MNSAEVQTLSLYRNEARWRKENTTPCWRKEITVGAILDQQMKGGRGTGHCWVNWIHRWALGKTEGTCGKTTTESTRSKIRLKVRIRVICICATVIKGTIAQCVMLY